MDVNMQFVLENKISFYHFGVEGNMVRCGFASGGDVCVHTTVLFGCRSRL